MWNIWNNNKGYEHSTVSALNAVYTLFFNKSINTEYYEYFVVNHCMKSTNATNVLYINSLVLHLVYKLSAPWPGILEQLNNLLNCSILNLDP